MTVTPDDVLHAAALATASLRSVADEDWSRPAGTLEWDVRRTIVHLYGGPAKHTLYLASRSEHFIALATTDWPDATRDEILASIEPVVAGLIRVVAATPPDVLVFHSSGPSRGAGYLARACVELLVHTDDVLTTFDRPFEPPDDLCRRVVEQQFPSHPHPPTSSAWADLVTATGRGPRTSGS